MSIMIYDISILGEGIEGEIELDYDLDYQVDDQYITSHHFWVGEHGGHDMWKRIMDYFSQKVLIKPCCG